MFKYRNKDGDIMLRWDSNSYTVADLREVLRSADDDAEVLVCIGQATDQDEQVFPDRTKGSIYSDKDLLVIEVM